MALHLLKLCVGVDTLEELQSHVSAQLAERMARGEEPRRYHTTRMTPRRKDELLNGGSLYWVIKGNIQCRSKLIALEPVTGKDGIRRCRLVMEPEIHPTSWQPRRPFQGWRYLKQDDAPADIDITLGGENAIPAKLRHELAELGLL